MNDKKIRINVLSDIHLSSNLNRMLFLKNALKNIKNSSNGCDIFVSVGDTTDGGNKDQWIAFQRIYEEIKPAENAVFALGNHDTWTDKYGLNDNSEEYDRAMPLYVDCRRRVTGIISDKSYYSDLIEGIPFIVLGTSASAVGAEVDEEQIEWFREEIKKASELNNFIFVISHWAFKNTHGLPYTFSVDRNSNEYEGSLGDGGEVIREELKKYRNVIFISGHSHMGWSPNQLFAENKYSSVEGVDGIVSINMPCFMFPNHDGQINTPGLGLQIEIFGNKAVFCPKLHLLNVLLEPYKFTVYKD